MKDYIIGFSLLWLLPCSIILTRIILYNIKIGTLKDFELDKDMLKTINFKLKKYKKKGKGKNGYNV